MKAIAAVLITTFTLTALGSASDAYLDTETGAMDFSVGLKMSSLSSSRVSLIGFGPTLAFDHAVGNNLAINLAVSQLFEGGQNSLYFGVSGGLKYAIFGSFYHLKNRLMHRGSAIVQEYERRGNLFAVGATVDQITLNGKDAVYPATGVSVLISYRTYVWDYPVSCAGKYSALSARGSDLSMFSIWTSLHF